MNSRRDYQTGRAALFDGIEEGGIRAYSTTEIDEVDNYTAEAVLQDRVNMLKRVGISGPGFEGIHDDEFRHSIVPIINEKLVALSFAKPGDPTVSDQEADSIPDSEGGMSDSEYDEKPEEPDGKHPDNFVEEVYGIVEEALKTDIVADVAGRVNNLRESYGMPGCRCDNHLFYWMMKSALETHDIEEEFNNYIEEKVIKWKYTLKYFIDNRFDETKLLMHFLSAHHLAIMKLGLIRQLERICSSSSNAFSPFLQVLTCLYKNDLVHKNTILYWAYDVGWEYGSDETFVNQSEDLVKMLKADPFSLVDRETFNDSDEYYRFIKMDPTTSNVTEGLRVGEMDVMTR